MKTNYYDIKQCFLQMAELKPQIERKKKLKEESKGFLLGTGRMPHLVGGAMGVTCITAVKRETPAVNSSLNIHKTT